MLFLSEVTDFLLEKKKSVIGQFSGSDSKLLKMLFYLTIHSQVLVLIATNANVLSE